MREFLFSCCAATLFCSCTQPRTQFAPEQGDLRVELHEKEVSSGKTTFDMSMESKRDGSSVGIMRWYYNHSTSDTALVSNVTVWHPTVEAVRQSWSESVNLESVPNNTQASLYEYDLTGTARESHHMYHGQSASGFVDWLYNERYAFFEEQERLPREIEEILRESLRVSSQESACTEADGLIDEFGFYPSEPDRLAWWRRSGNPFWNEDAGDPLSGSSCWPQNIASRVSRVLDEFSGNRNVMSDSIEVETRSLEHLWVSRIWIRDDRNAEGTMDSLFTEDALKHPIPVTFCFQEKVPELENEQRNGVTYSSCRWLFDPSRIRHILEKAFSDQTYWGGEEEIRNHSSSYPGEFFRITIKVNGKTRTMNLPGVPTDMGGWSRMPQVVYDTQSLFPSVFHNSLQHDIDWMRLRMPLGARAILWNNIDRDHSVWKSAMWVSPEFYENQTGTGPK